MGSNDVRLDEWELVPGRNKKYLSSTTTKNPVT
jgi:hypothetical protein